MTALELQKEWLLGAGRFRQCYTHPENPRWIIKTEKTGIAGGNGINSPHSRELRFYEQLTDNTHFAKFIGTVHTNLGRGLVFEKIQNVDGSKAAKLMEVCQLTGILPEELYVQIIAMMEQLEKDGLLSCSVYPENLLVITEEDKQRLISCDSKVISNKQWFTGHIGFFQKCKIKRRHKRLLKLYQSLCEKH